MNKKILTYGLTHLAIAVKDLNRTLAFYEHLFDVEVMYQQEDFLQVCTPGGKDIIVFEKSESKSIGQSGGIAHFGFRLKESGDIGEVVKRIAAAGGKIKERGEFVPGEPYVFFYDPDGYLIEVWYELLP